VTGASPKDRTRRFEDKKIEPMTALSAWLQDARHVRAHRNGEHLARLLVSVRSADEARAAVAGGADIIDVKEPARGSLGMAEVSVMDEVIQSVRRLSPETPVTAALGELNEWDERRDPACLPAGLSYLKLGLAGAGRNHNWVPQWLHLRSEVDRHAAPLCGWIAVAYADAEAAHAPDPESVVAAAAETACRGVLFDTWGKGSGSLLDHVYVVRLEALCARARSAGLLVALAGRLTAANLVDVVGIRPDVVAIRSAACADGRRSAPICAERVGRFRARLRRACRRS
jgi:uncharacterized protein (UPF0264 family)